MPQRFWPTDAVNRESWQLAVQAGSASRDTGPILQRRCQELLELAGGVELAPTVARERALSNNVVAASTHARMGSFGSQRTPKRVSPLLSQKCAPRLGLSSRPPPQFRFSSEPLWPSSR